MTANASECDALVASEIVPRLGVAGTPVVAMAPTLTLDGWCATSERAHRTASPARWCSQRLARAAATVRVSAHANAERRFARAGADREPRQPVRFARP
jgi:hypothetical protein